MTFHHKLQKILMIKEREKDEVMTEYNEAVGEFEKEATKLYELLKQKEQFEQNQKELLLKGLPIQQIQQNEMFLMSITRSIKQYQQTVADARTVMEVKESKLLEKNIEVKKFEKIKEKRLLQFIEYQKNEEAKMMDEISNQQYMNKGN